MFKCFHTTKELKNTSYTLPKDIQDLNLPLNQNISYKDNTEEIQIYNFFYLHHFIVKKKSDRNQFGFPTIWWEAVFLWLFKGLKLYENKYNSRKRVRNKICNWMQKLVKRIFHCTARHNDILKQIYSFKKKLMFFSCIFMNIESKANKIKLGQDRKKLLIHLQCFLFISKYILLSSSKTLNILAKFILPVLTLQI